MVNTTGVVQCGNNNQLYFLETYIYVFKKKIEAQSCKKKILQNYYNKQCVIGTFWPQTGLLTYLRPMQTTVVKNRFVF